jgi:outer membrane biosynthesis protein TonB
MKLAGKRLWRTEDGRLVEDGDADARILAYAEGDQLTEDDETLVDDIEETGPQEIEGVLVKSDLAGTGPAVNAETGQVTAPGEPLPPIDAGPDAKAIEPLPQPEPEPEPEPEKPAAKATSKPEPEKPAAKATSKPEPEKPAAKATSKPRSRATVKR